MKFIIISTPIGFIGSGKGGGVELTLLSLVKGLLAKKQKVVVIAPNHSYLMKDCQNANLIAVDGADQHSWQHMPSNSKVIVSNEFVLTKMIRKAFEIGNNEDVILNMAYDWLPIWLTSYSKIKIFNLISMGGVSTEVVNLVSNLSLDFASRLAFHTQVQANDYKLKSSPNIIGNGFDLELYKYNSINDGPIGWVGRIAPEKGLEDAAKVAFSLGENLMVWGVKEDVKYAKEIEDLFPSGLIQWKGFLKTKELQKELGECRVLLNTPKWNEAYGNVVVEAMACGVPVIAYKRGGPGELILHGENGYLATPDNIQELVELTKQINLISRKKCRLWAEENASIDVFVGKVFSWINSTVNLIDV
tara:strand:- start:1058 stop:2137 length:1080 start_codon:yes stop_codon:yes gene_type:complete